jgi:hypothetical protein
VPAKPKSRRREIGPEELCPCGSGAKYRYCHKKTTKRFFEQENGDIVAEMPLHPDLAAQLEKSREEFKSIFGRDPYKTDPMIWNRAEVKENTLLKHTKKAMYAAEIREELIFAYERTGLIVVKNSPITSPLEKKEFHDAIDEYFSLQENGADPFFVFTYLNSPQYNSFKESRK